MSDSDTQSTPFADRLCRRILATQSVVCVGLDPRAAQLPGSFAINGNASPEALAQAFETFCTEIIDVVADRVPIVKPQAAFFEALGPAGCVALANVIRYAIDRDMLVILDGKRNDIGSTAAAYADAYLGRGKQSAWGSDSLTVSPYLGDDSLQPFIDACDTRDAGIFVLVKTSNPNGGFLQDRPTDGQTVYQRVAEFVSEQNATRKGQFGYGPIGTVVGATYPQQLSEMRSAMPGTLILIPGFGAQGGAVDDILGGFDNNGLGAIVNSSRHIIFAHARPEFQSIGISHWQDAVAAATDLMNQQIGERIQPGRP
ncbi:MAG: orotidine-5'-phosphate decarboxylase [Planctomycetota bacterium]